MSDLKFPFLSTDIHVMRFLFLAVQMYQSNAYMEGADTEILESGSSEKK